MQAAQFTESGGPLSVVTLPKPSPSSGEIRIRVLACGICHGDVMTKYAAMGCKLPRTP